MSGSTITSLILIWLVYTETKSALAITYLGIASLLPTIAFGLLIGVVVDRLNRKALMIASDLVRAISVAAIPVFLILKGFSFPLVLTVVGIVGLFSTVFRPATNSLLPKLVPGEAVQSANGIISGSNSVVQMISNAVGGLLIGFAGVTLGLFYNTGTYLVSAAMIAMIAVPSHLTIRGTRAHATYLSEFREGLSFIRRNKAVLETTVSFTVINFFGTMIGSFLVVYVSRHLVESGTFFGFLVAALGLGIAVGSLMVQKLNTVGYAGKLFIAASAAYGVGATLLVMTRLPLVAILITAAMGMALGFTNTTFFSLMQLVVPNEILGRILSVDEVGSFAAIPLGQIVAGLIIASAGIEFNYLMAGAGVIITATAMLFLKDLRNFRYTSPTNIVPHREQETHRS